jgi:hypothetical protein
MVFFPPVDGDAVWPLEENGWEEGKVPEKLEATFLVPWHYPWKSEGMRTRISLTRIPLAVGFS